MFPKIPPSPNIEICVYVLNTITYYTFAKLSGESATASVYYSENTGKYANTLCKSQNPQSLKFYFGFHLIRPRAHAVSLLLNSIALTLV